MDTKQIFINDGDVVKFSYHLNKTWYAGVGVFHNLEYPYVLCNDKVLSMEDVKHIEKINDNSNISIGMSVTEFYGTISGVHWEKEPMLTHVIDFKTSDGQTFSFGNIDFIKFSASKYLNVLMSVVGTKIDAADLIGKELYCSVQNGKIVAIADFNGRISIMDLRNLYEDN